MKRIAVLMFGVFVALSFVFVISCSEETLDKPEVADVERQVFGEGAEGPFVSETVPYDGQKNVPINTGIVIVFNIEITNSGVVYVNGNLIRGELSEDGKRYTVIPPFQFPTNSVVEVEVKGFVSINGKAIPTYKFSFTTGSKPDLTPPYIITTAPLTNEVDAGFSLSVVAVFNEAIMENTGYIKVYKGSNGTSPMSGTTSYGTYSITFSPSTNLELGTWYRVEVGEVRDIQSNQMTNEFVYYFRTKQYLLDFVPYVVGDHNGWKGNDDDMKMSWDNTNKVWVKSGVIVVEEMLSNYGSTNDITKAEMKITTGSTSAGNWFGDPYNGDSNFMVAFSGDGVYTIKAYEGITGNNIAVITNIVLEKESNYTLTAEGVLSTNDTNSGDVYLDLYYNCTSETYELLVVDYINQGNIDFLVANSYSGTANLSSSLGGVKFLDGSGAETTSISISGGKANYRVVAGSVLGTGTYTISVSGIGNIQRNLRVNSHIGFTPYIVGEFNSWTPTADDMKMYWDTNSLKWVITNVVVVSSMSQGGDDGTLVEFKFTSQNGWTNTISPSAGGTSPNNNFNFTLSGNGYYRFELPDTNAPANADISITKVTDYTFPDPSLITVTPYELEIETSQTSDVLTAKAWSFLTQGGAVMQLVNEDYGSSDYLASSIGGISFRNSANTADITAVTFSGGTAEFRVVGSSTNAQGYVFVSNSSLNLVGTNVIKVGGTTPHTIVIDASNDFSTNSEKIQTTSGGYYVYLTWDGDNIYLGVEGTDIGGGAADTKWVFVYISTNTNDTSSPNYGLRYNSQRHLLPFHAHYHLAFKTTLGWTNQFAVSSSRWVSSSWWTGAVARDSSAGFMELSIPLSNIGGAVPVWLTAFIVNEASGGEWTYSGIYADNFTDGKHKASDIHSPTKFVEVTLETNVAPNSSSFERSSVFSSLSLTVDGNGNDAVWSSAYTSVDEFAGADNNGSGVGSDGFGDVESGDWDGSNPDQNLDWGSVKITNDSYFIYFLITNRAGGWTYDMLYISTNDSTGASEDSWGKAFCFSNATVKPDFEIKIQNSTNSPWWEYDRWDGSSWVHEGTNGNNPSESDICFGVQGDDANGQPTSLEIKVSLGWLGLLKGESFKWVLIGTGNQYYHGAFDVIPSDSASGNSNSSAQADAWDETGTPNQVNVGGSYSADW